MTTSSTNEVFWPHRRCFVKNTMSFKMLQEITKTFECEPDLNVKLFSFDISQFQSNSILIMERHTTGERQMALLHEKFNGQVISRRSCDLMPLNFIYLGCLKPKLYVVVPTTIRKQKDGIIAAYNLICVSEPPHEGVPRKQRLPFGQQFCPHLIEL